MDGWGGRFGFGQRSHEGNSGLALPIKVKERYKQRSKKQTKTSEMPKFFSLPFCDYFPADQFEHAPGLKAARKFERHGVAYC